MPRDPYAEHETTDGSEVVSVYSCPFCETAHFSDLLIDAMGELKAHVRDVHPSDYHVVMNVLDQTIRKRDRMAKQAARDHAGLTLSARRN